MSARVNNTSFLKNKTKNQLLQREENTKQRESRS